MKRRIMISTALLFSAIALSACNGKNAASCDEQTKIVKSAWDKAPAGMKKDAALVHYQDAEKAAVAKDEKACLAALELASAALK